MAENYLYKSITDDLREAILSGEYSPNDMIPSENELSAEYATSRVTVRKALRILENEGLIKPLRGKGYFVLSPEFNRFTFNFSDKPSGSSSKYEEINIIPADGELAECLRIRKGDMLVVIRRVIMIGASPCAFDEKYIPYSKGEPVIERELNYSQFPDMFTGKYVPRAIWTNMDIMVSEAPVYVSRALGCDENTPLLCVSRTVCTKDGIHIGFGRRWLIGKYGKLNATSDYYTMQL